MKRLTLVGDGRLARHLQHYLKDLIGLQLFSRREARQSASCFEALEESSCIALAISDDSIENFYHSHRHFFPNATWCHFSGSLDVEGMLSFHPLMTFSTELYPAGFYPQITFVSDQKEESFRRLFPDLKNPFVQISKEKRALYHALCVVGGNFSSILWDEVERRMKNLGVEACHLQPYKERIFSNILKDAASSLTGPLQRRDLKTIEKNLEALSGDPLKEVYKSFWELKK